MVHLTSTNCVSCPLIVKTDGCPLRDSGRDNERYHLVNGILKPVDLADVYLSRGHSNTIRELQLEAYGPARTAFQVAHCQSQQLEVGRHGSFETVVPEGDRDLVGPGHVCYEGNNTKL